MYQDFFGLRERPFDLTSNPRYLLLTAGHQEGLSNLEYGVTHATGITLLLGEAGTGKTTLLRAAHARCRQRAEAGSMVWTEVSNPMLSRYEFLDTIAHGFGLADNAAGSKSHFLRVFEEALLHNGRTGTLNVLVVDEAQSLPDELLEEVRLLANIESDAGKLLRVVLAGQLSFRDTLRDPRFCQFKQRIGLRCTLDALTLHETAAYIARRISLAGGDPAATFTRDAILAIFERSAGIPRTINVICDNTLLTAFATNERPAGCDLVAEVCRDLDLAMGTNRDSREVGPRPVVRRGPSDAPTGRSQVVPERAWARRFGLSHLVSRST